MLNRLLSGLEHLALLLGEVQGEFFVVVGPVGTLLAVSFFVLICRVVVHVERVAAVGEGRVLRDIQVVVSYLCWILSSGGVERRSKLEVLTDLALFG